MEVLLVIGIVLLVATLLTWITKIDIAYLFAPAIFFISGWEFIFGLLGYLNLGMKYLVLSLGVTVFIFLVKSAGFRSQFAKCLVAPGTIAFVSLSMISIYKSKDWKLSIWDELSHWGVFTKAMYKYDALAPATPVDLWHASYPPGVSLFQYFVMEFSQGYREGLLFGTMHLIVISIVVAAFAKSTYKYPSEIFLRLFLALVASSAFLNGFDTIYQDAILALAFGFLIVVAIKATYVDGRWGLILALSAGFVTLLKPIGIYLAVASILINIVATVFTVKFNSGRKIIVAFVPSLVSLITVVTIWVTWGKYISKFGLNPETTAAYLNTVRNLETQEEAIANFIRAFSQVPLPSSVLAMPSRTWTIICAILFAVWAYLDGYRNRKRNIFIGITLLFTTLGYFCVIFLSYLTVFAPGEAAGLASYDRYIATWYQGIFFATVLLILTGLTLNRDIDSSSITDLESKNRNKKSNVGVVLIALVAIGSLSSPNPYIGMLRTPQYKGLEVRAQFDPMLDEIKAANIPDGSKVYIITQHKVGFEYFVLRYEMIGNDFGAMPFSIGSPSGEGDIWTEPTMNAEKWTQTLLDFDYVVLYNSTESFINEFSLLFKNGIVEENSVYKVVKLSNSSLLTKIP
ncbi:MAG: hypothetical protein RI895_143 [Actinomycetota bacterium]|jgi:hypothetical protein